MKCWGTIEIPQKIEFISYSPEYHDQVLEVIRQSFFRYETVSVGSEIDKNLDAQKDLELLCIDVLKKSGVSLIARDVEKNLVVGAALNVLQVNKINLIRKLTNQILIPRSNNRRLMLRRTLRRSEIDIAKRKMQNL